MSDRAGNAARRRRTVGPASGYVCAVDSRNLTGMAGATVSDKLVEARRLNAFKITLLFDGTVLKVANVTTGAVTSVAPGRHDKAGSVSIGVESALGSGAGSVTVVNMTVVSPPRPPDLVATVHLRIAERRHGVDVYPERIVHGEQRDMPCDANGDGRVNHATPCTFSRRSG